MESKVLLTFMQMNLYFPYGFMCYEIFRSIPMGKVLDFSNMFNLKLDVVRGYWPCDVKWWKVLKNIRLLRSEVNVKPKKRNFRSISDFLNYDFLNIVKAKPFVCSGTFYTIPQRY